MLADVVHAHIGRVEQTSHTGRVHDMALPQGIFFGGLQHHGRENAYAMHDAHHIDAQYPFPVFHRVFPDQATRANACVIENKVRRTKPRQHRCAQRFHPAGTRHIDFAGQHLCTSRFKFTRCSVKRVLLHIYQHQVHAQPGTNSGALQSKAGACARQNGRFIFEICDHYLLLIYSDQS